MAPQGIYASGSWYNSEWDYDAHAIKANKLRKYARRSLNLDDSEDTKKKSANYGWFSVPRDKGCTSSKDRYGGGAVYCSHKIDVDTIKKFCIEELSMVEIQPEIVTVTVEVPVYVEVPLALSFEERDILTTALHREQHLNNEMLRRAYVDDDIAEARLYTGRLGSIVDLMTRLGIDPDNWANGPAWLVDTDFVSRETDQPGEVNDTPQIQMFT